MGSSIRRGTAGTWKAAEESCQTDDYRTKETQPPPLRDGQAPPRGARRSFGGASGRVGLPKQSGEVPELGESEVRDPPVRVVRRGPVQQVIALLGTGRGTGGGAARRGPQEHVDQVLTPAVDERRDGSAADVVEPAADQRIVPAGEIEYGRRKVQLAVEPGLHRVLVGGGHVGEVAGHERADVACEHIVGERLAGRALEREPPAAGGADRGGSGERPRTPHGP